MVSFRIFSEVCEAGDAIVSIFKNYLGLLAYVFLAGFTLNFVGKVSNVLHIANDT